MHHSTTIQEIVEQLETFPPILQKQVLDFTLELADEMPEGATIHEFLKFSGTIPSEDLEQMKHAIEEGCEQVYASEW